MNAVSARTRSWSGVRRFSTALAGLTAILAGTVAALGVWGQTVLLDTGGSGPVVARIVASADVARGLGEHLGDQLVRLYDENISFASRVPDALKDEAAALDMTITEEIRKRSLSVAASEPVRDAVAEAGVEAHAALVDSLASGPSSEAEPVRLNLIPAVTALFQSLQEQGAWPDTPSVPDVDPNVTPAEQVATLESSLGITLPDGLASVRLFDATDEPQGIRTARQVTDSIGLATWASCVIFLLSITIAMAGARTPWGRLVTGSVAVFVAAATVWLLARLAPTRVASTIHDGTWSLATEDITTILVAPLVTWSVVAAVAALAASGVAELLRRHRRRIAAELLGGG